MLRKLDKEQIKTLSAFFSNIAVGWFIVIFATPDIFGKTNPLTIIIYFVNMIIALGISLYLAKEKNNIKV